MNVYRNEKRAGIALRAALRLIAAATLGAFLLAGCGGDSDDNNSGNTPGGDDTNIDGGTPGGSDGDGQGGNDGSGNDQGSNPDIGTGGNSPVVNAANEVWEFTNIAGSGFAFESNGKIHSVAVMGGSWEKAAEYGTWQGNQIFTKAGATNTFTVIPAGTDEETGTPYEERLEIVMGNSTSILKRISVTWWDE